MKAKWPESVPVLTKEDMYQGMFDGPRETHCLQGWRFVVFGLRNSKIADKVDRVLRESARQKVISLGHEFRNLAYVNDWQVTKAQAAEIWNSTMRKFGYTEIVEDE